MLTQTDMRFFYFIPILDEKLYPARLPYETHTKRDTNAYGPAELDARVDSNDLVNHPLRLPGLLGE